MKVPCIGKDKGCDRMANWFIKRREDVVQIGSGKIFCFCDKCIKKTGFGERVFSSQFYRRYFAPKGIDFKTFSRLDFEDMRERIKEGARWSPVS